MADVGAWSSRPVFITSTFHDMQAERDLLRNVVFPALEEKLKARRVHLEWIDLRVGVANPAAESEEAFEAQVLKVCLEEVKRSRPFLVGLIGDRYGWVPSRERAEAAVEEAAVEEAERGIAAALEGRSVTDLEIDFGVVSDPEQRKRSLFWFRQPLPYDAMTPETAAEFSDAHATDPEAPKRQDDPDFWQLIHIADVQMNEAILLADNPTGAMEALSIDLRVCEASTSRHLRTFCPGHNDRHTSRLGSRPNGFWRYASFDEVHDVKLTPLGLPNALNHLRR